MGPAGFSAALYLARFRRQVVVVNAGHSRAASIPVSHNYLGAPQGVSGNESLEPLREQARLYGVEIIKGTAHSLSRLESGFQEIDARERESLADLNIELIDTGIKAIETPSGPRVNVSTHSGASYILDTLYLMVGCHPSVEILKRFGVGQDDIHQLWVDEHQQTSVYGIYAAGDVVHALKSDERRCSTRRSGGNRHPSCPTAQLQVSVHPATERWMREVRLPQIKNA